VIVALAPLGYSAAGVHERPAFTNAIVQHEMERSMLGCLCQHTQEVASSFYLFIASAFSLHCICVCCTPPWYVVAIARIRIRSASRRLVPLTLHMAIHSCVKFTAGIRAIVTGGASGLGLATAKLLASRGAKVLSDAQLISGSRNP
jgi:hypothetical protein